MKISVSTLGCPAWSLSQILTNCRRYGYDGVELRGIEGQLDLTQTRYFATASAIVETRARFEDAGLEIPAVDCSASLASARGIEKARAEARATVDIANALGATFIRVFGGEATDGESYETATARLVEELFLLGDYASDRNVAVLLENHDAYATGAPVAEVLGRVRHSAVGVLWDVHNSATAGESVSESVSMLRPYLRLVHVKESSPEGVAAGEAYCPLGEGDTPIREAIAELIEVGYKGYVSVEWEKRWHPNLLEPEVVFPQYADTLREYLGQASLVVG